MDALESHVFVLALPAGIQITQAIGITIRLRNSYYLSDYLHSLFG